MDFTILVNKKKGLVEGFAPPALVDVKSKYKNGIQLNKTAYEQWLKLKEAVLLKNYEIDIESGYRSSEYQASILKELIAEKGEEYASKAIALPNHSEHQTGLAVDYCVVRSGGFIIEAEMDKCEECCYTNNIAHKYGFIVRYPKNCDDITGYQYEPWHLRYVGSELANYLFVNKITLDEFYKENENEEN
ncbi:MAG: M15 family metallopeptidase [Bacilli bacterium]|nr:M15 family metallopeptidase [Bacilli bacterium]MDD4053359.1 M15 family metallopeptidase [Bacilli bacterium]MDD4410994.1 M15 family metallopeptidase [Bacilli bacterium]